MNPRVTDADEVRVEVYCRQTTDAVVPLDRHHRRLVRLSRAGVVDDLSVKGWPGRVSLAPGDSGETLPRERSEAVRTRQIFEEWADREDVALGPAFGRREYDSTFTDESGEVLRFPVVALAVYVDGDLSAVYPHEDDGPVTVERGIDRLAAGGQRTRVSGERPRSTSD